MKMTAIQKTNHKPELAILLVILVVSAITIAVSSSIALGQGEKTHFPWHEADRTQSLGQN